LPKIDFEGSVLSYATQAIPMKKKVTSKIRKIQATEEDEDAFSTVRGDDNANYFF